LERVELTAGVRMRFERGLCPREPILGEASEGAVEAPADD